ncbi:MAG: lipopolysaccharide transport periplasmic protein LptA [Gammaproteobacteria bacterium]|nr:lipopolysaccharide transport periplasmic protein LptA [Gammaproteobacteria bacterium]
MTSHRLLFAALFCLALPALAAPTSRIQADKMELREAEGITVFTGDVVYTQREEAVTIHADRITVHSKDNELIRVEARGKPVRFSHLGGDKPVTGEARQLDYDGAAELVILTGDAYVTSGSDRIQGARIEYDMINKQAQASGGESEGRFEAVITPSSNETEQ